MNTTTATNEFGLTLRLLPSVSTPVEKEPVREESKPAFEGFEAIALRNAALGYRVFPVDPLKKKASIKKFPELATSNNVGRIKEWATKFPNASCGLLATSEGHLFIDEDVSAEFRSGYETFAGEPFPVSRATESRPNHRQSHWLQTDYTRANLKNITQDKTKDSMFSLRFHNYLVLGEGSQHPSGLLYRVVVDSPVISMPDKLVDYVLSLLTTKRKASAVVPTASPTLNVSGPDGERVPPQFDVIFEESGHGRNSGVSAYAWWVYQNKPREVLESWVHQYNDEHCVPPLENKEVDDIIHGKLDKHVTGANAILIGGVPSSQSPVVLGTTAASAHGASTLAEPLAWDEPKPFEPLLAPVPPCKLEYLPEAFRDYAQDVAERMSLPLDFVVICMMCSFAAVVGRRAFVYPKANDNSWKEALNLLGAVVAPSGSKKSPAWRHFVNPIIEIEADWRVAFELEMENYRKQMEVYAQINKNAKKEKTIPPNPPSEPKPRRRIVFNDATPEKMHAMMEVNPEGLYSFQDEIGGWLAMMDKKGREAERRMFLAAANGDEWFTLDRIERGEVGAWMCSSYFGGMQPFVCQALVNDPRNVGDGTTARFGLLSYPDNVTFTPRIDRKENEVAKIQYAEILREFAPLTVRAISLKFDADAQPIFNNWQDAHDERVLSLSESVTRSHLSKYNGLVPRLAALYQLADIAAVSVNTEGVSAGVSGLVLIDAAHLSRAIAFVTEYLEPHMNRVYGCIKSSWQLAEASLAEHIKAGDLRMPFTARDITRKHWSHLKDAESVSFAIETFIEYGWLRQMPTPVGQRGQPAIRYEVNPAAVASKGKSR